MSNKAVRITIYNHKGGVGKTTLTVNIANALAAFGKQVLLVDSDPQCNLTSHLLSDDVVDDLLNKSTGPDGSTIWSGVKNLIDGGQIQAITPVNVGNTSLIPGDIRMSEYEEFLGEAWTDSFKRRLGGLRATTSINDLADATSTRKNYDYIFYDTGPNIGPLNRVLLLGSDYFIVPVACDLFSVRALSTLGQTLKRWIIDWNTINSLAPDGASLLRGNPKFLGYIPQRFRVYGQVMAQEPSHYFARIRRRITDDITSVLRSVSPDLVPHSPFNYLLGSVKDYGSLVQLAQKEGVPIWECSTKNTTQKNNALATFKNIASNIITHTSFCPPSPKDKKR